MSSLTPTFYVPVVGVPAAVVGPLVEALLDVVIGALTVCANPPISPDPVLSVETLLDFDGAPPVKVLPGEDRLSPVADVCVADTVLLLDALPAYWALSADFSIWHSIDPLQNYF